MPKILQVWRSRTENFPEPHVWVAWYFYFLTIMFLFGYSALALGIICAITCTCLTPGKGRWSLGSLLRGGFGWKTFPFKNGCQNQKIIKGCCHPPLLCCVGVISCRMYPKNHGISKLVLWKPCYEESNPLFWRVQWFLRGMTSKRPGSEIAHLVP